MSKNRIIVTSVVIEGRTKAAVARDYGVTYRWVHTLVTRYLTGGWDAIEPQSRRPKTSPSRISASLEAEILQLRHELTAAGHDAEPHTIATHLHRHHGTTPAVSTVWKTLKRHGLITAQPKKRPRSSYLRFEAELPNETWQSDFTHWKLANGTGMEILTFLDDHSRLALSVTAYRVVTVTHVLAEFRTTVAQYGPPVSTLTDNGLVFTTRVRQGRNTFENELNLLGIDQKNGRPNHPQTQGKVERFQQTLKNWLTKQPRADTIEELQQQLNTFTDYYNTVRPHRSLDRTTPVEAYTARGKATPAGTDGHWRIRDDRIDESGVVTLRYNSRLHHIGIGRAHKGERIRLLIHNRDIRIINTRTGELLRELTLDPEIDYQPQKTQNALPKESEM
ncbi:IS481 family transposase [Rhodoglobus aureus]|uniref:IS481 family transposase n=1 Tax=Rhodoglobus aureus TaxID=191497 RepID=A0ABN1VDI4_9MICO